MEPVSGIAIGQALKNLKLADIAKLLAGVGVLIFGIAALIFAYGWSPEWNIETEVVVDAPYIDVQVPENPVTVNITDNNTVNEFITFEHPTSKK